MLNFTLNQTSFAQSPELASGVLADVLLHSSNLREFYPDFDVWLNNKVIPDLELGDRAILTEYRDGHLAGFAIIKDDGAEKKLCCLRIIKQFQNSRGMGVRLFERAFEELSCEKPLLSVAEEHVLPYSRMFKYFGFEHSVRYSDIYRIGKDEYAYNGLLDSNKASVNFFDFKIHESMNLIKQSSASY